MPRKWLRRQLREELEALDEAHARRAAARSRRGHKVGPGPTTEDEATCLLFIEADWDYPQSDDESNPSPY